MAAGSLIMKKESGGRNWIQIVIIRTDVNKDWWHSWRQAFLEYFALGGFGSPEKHRGFVLLLFGDHLNLLNLLNLN